MNKINILLAAIIIISFSIRLYPTLLTGAAILDRLLAHNIQYGDTTRIYAYQPRG
jgi:hypothetical protein